MPVPTSIDQLSTTPASNFPAGSDSPSSLDDTIRATSSFIATIRDTVGLGTGTLVPATARTNFGAAASGANTDITSVGAITGVTAAGGDNSTKLATTAFVSASSSTQLQPISAVANTPANGLTISASALSLDFRSATLTSGTVTRVSGTPANLVISSGSTLGTVSAQQSRIVVLALNAAGVIKLAAVNISGGNDLSETGVVTTVAEGGAGAADSANVIYSDAVYSNVAYRVLGYIESTQATAGTWVTAPSTIQGRGGQALAAMSSLGYGQNWQTITLAASTTYYNTFGKPVVYRVGITSSGAGQYGVPVTVNGFAMPPSNYGAAAGAGLTSTADYLVPPNQSIAIGVPSNCTVTTSAILR